MKTIKHDVVILLAALPLLLIPASALAHVTISPQESATGATEIYNIRVPTERDSPTVQIEVDFPDEVVVQTVEPTGNWKVDYVRDSAGRVDKAIWSGGSIAPDEYEVFSFEAKNPDNAGTLTYKAIQIHADGSRAEWVSERGSRNPAPTVDIRIK